ncbi:MAG TPA: response regulator transcription factor [Gemmatimonadales bacterium]|jgi:two-component system copper resistance phosphate regulon response regulator CusR
MRVLIVEDEPAVADLLERTVREAAWAPDVVATGAKALEALAVNDYDLAILDVGLPDIDGFEVCRRWRQRGGRTPVLMLTARAGLGDRVTGLDAGADDYLGKPFAIEELMARLRALARRPPSPLSVSLKVGDLEMNTNSREARRAGRTIKLTAREYALLEYLLRNPDRVVTRGQILEHVWDDNFDPVGNVVDVLIGRLRRKVDTPGFPPLIHTARGAGYLLSARGKDAV